MRCKNPETQANPAAFMLLAFTLTLPNLSLAETEKPASPFRDPEDGRIDASQYLAENAFGFLPVPIIITDPAVDGGLGLTGLFFHESDAEAAARKEAMQSSDEGAGRHLLPPNVSAVAAGYTGNDSWFAGGGHLGFFKEGRIRYAGGGGYGDVSLDFFGFGEIEFDEPVSLNTEAFAVVQTLKYKIGDRPMFAGVAQRFVSASISPSNLDFLDGTLPPDVEDEIRDRLTQDVQTSALGLVFEFDNRDNFFSPRKGYRYKFDYYFYRDWLGSDIDYELLKFQGLNYWKLGDQFRLGLRIQAEYADANSLLPPFATPSIQLRGIQAARYQGNYVGVVESEFTWQIDSRWSALIFGGIGRAANGWDELLDADNRATRGAGFRYLIARRYGFDMGIDVARGPEDTVWYIQAGSAWGR